MLRFWLDRGVDGIRIDSAALLIKDSTLADFTEGVSEGQHPFVDIPEVHEVYRAWRRLTDSYPDERILIGEVWLPDRERFARYLGADELHTAFNFDFLGAAWDADRMRAVIDGTLADHAAGAGVADLGAVEPRRRTARHPLRQAATRRSRWTTGGWVSSPTSSWAPAGHAQPSW